MPKTKEKPKVMVPRLPPESRKVTFWDGNVWSGTFIVLGEQFDATASNEKNLLWKLDELYRDWLKQQSPEVKAKHAAHLS